MLRPADDGLTEGNMFNPRPEQREMILITVAIPCQSEEKDDICALAPRWTSRMPIGKNDV
ncbi:MAG: hypothetical protein ACPLYD_02715 [Anaerolineae bacterium]